MKNLVYLFVMALVVGSCFISCGKDSDSDDDNTPTTVPEKGVLINGVRWATRNVDNPGTFAATPESAGKFYQWNCKKAWPATGKVSGWNDDYYSTSATWEKENDPSPAGWRVPTCEDFEKLCDTDKVSYEWTGNGGKFTDKVSGNSIFLPAAGYRGYYGGTLYSVGWGCYWSSTWKTDGISVGYRKYTLYFQNSSAGWISWDNSSSGYTVRPVADF